MPIKNDVREGEVYRSDETGIIWRVVRVDRSVTATLEFLQDKDGNTDPEGRGTNLCVTTGGGLANIFTKMEPEALQLQLDRATLNERKRCRNIAKGIDDAHVRMQVLREIG